MRRTIAILMIILGMLILLVVAYFIVYFILSIVPLPPDPIVLVPTIAMLGNPFRTTRKMKVPFHNRKGHVERNTEKLFLLIVRLTFGVAFFLWLFQQASQK